MRRLFSRIAPFVILFASSGRAAADPPFPVGVNLAGVSDWGTEFSFADAFKTSRPWISQKQGQPWGKGGELKVESGWVKELAPEQFAEALMFVDIGNRYPGGKYVCLYKGTGTVEFGHAAKVEKSEPGRIELEVTPDKGMLTLKVTKTPVEDVRLIPADLEKDGPIFRPAFLKRYEGFGVIRFMDWQRTNDSKQGKWGERPLPTDATQASNKGVAIEHCCDLAIAMKADPWFCIPHLADNEYVEKFAQLVRDRLKETKLKVYVEYSNETWNGQFEQARYCARKGKELGLSENAYEGQLRYSAQRSVEIFKIFEKEFGSKDRLVRVLSAHSVNPWSGTTVMDWKDAAKSADAIAIAPYFGNAFGDPKTADQVAAMSVDEILDGCQKSIESNKKHLEKYAAEAKTRGLKLMAYEAGQHLAGYGGAENNEKLMKLFHEANRHPRMKDLYLQDMKNWAEAGGSTYCLFSSVGRYSKWGSWGLKEYEDDPDDKAPKLQAVREVISGRGK